MQQVTKTYDVYSFQELEKDVQDSLIEEEQRTTLEGYDWWENTYEHIKAGMKSQGFTDVDIYFSGFWSQGDGACFDATIDLYQWMKNMKILSKYRILAQHAKEGWATAGIRTICTQYNHEHTRRAGIELDSGRLYSPQAESELQAVERLLEINRVHICEQIYKSLEKEYEYQTSEESCRDHLESTNWTYLKDGTRFDN